MEEERIELSAKERERLKVLHEITHGHLLQIDAARRLRLSDRQVRRLLQRLGSEVGRKWSEVVGRVGRCFREAWRWNWAVRFYSERANCEGGASAAKAARISQRLVSWLKPRPTKIRP
jgi:hypothetical protein